MLFIVLCSVLALAVVFYKFLHLRESEVLPEALVSVLAHPEVGVAQLRQHMSEGGSTLARIARTALSGNYSSKEEVGQAVQATAREEVVKLERGIAVLEVVITIAPLLGLLGTVSGLVSVFSTLGASEVGGADPTQIALGIAEALNTTIAGLAVAVPAVIAHSFFTRKIERMAVRMEVLLSSLITNYYGPQPSHATEGAV